MDVVAHLSRREGLPRALPQALAPGRPVVAYDCDGANEVCFSGQTGFLIPVGDVKTLAERLAQLAGDAGLARAVGAPRAGIRARKFCRRNHGGKNLRSLPKARSHGVEVNIVAVYAAACLSAALATAVSVPFWRRWCLKSGAMDDPGHRKIHTSPIPLAGGMAVMTGLLVALLAGVVVALAASRSSVAGLFEYGLSVRAVQLLSLTAGRFGDAFDWFAR
jgi:hypothetical protein